MRILHSLGWIGSGGVEVARLELIRRLRPPTHEHLLLCLSADGPIAAEMERLDAEIVEVGEISSMFSPGRYRLGRRVVRSWHPDVIHGGVMEGNQLAVAMGLTMRVPVITEETSDPADRRIGGHIVARTLYALSDRCVAVSPFVGRYLTDQLHVPVGRVSVVTNGVRAPAVPQPHDRTELRRRLGLADRDIVVGTVCRLRDAHKRVSDLIEAVALLRHAHPRLRLLVVGDGPDFGALRAQASSSGVASRVIFTGRQIPADPYYAIMDVFALASAREAFGLVAAEAMLVGLPVVATRVGGLAEVVQDEATGILVPPRDPSAFATALSRLLSDESVRRRMGAAGQKRAQEYFAIERYVREIDVLYQDVSNRRRQR